MDAEGVEVFKEEGVRSLNNKSKTPRPLATPLKEGMGEIFHNCI